MAQLDIAEKRLPQDGRITLRVAGKPVDVRVSTIPTGHGERVVMRLLDKQAGRLDLGKLGMDEATLTEMDGLIRKPHGIVLVTGPTGSGKTTTLYAALSRLDATALNIMTVEDPIEYDLDGISQTQVNARIEMSFARALRTILRQDPDVVMIGEIRDLETAQIAVQASLTGHLVFATLHTNSAISTINRIIDVFPPHQQQQVRAKLSFVLQGVVSQQLIPRLGAPGRCLALEIMIPNAAIRNLIREDKVHQIYSSMQVGQDKHGMQTLNQALFSLYSRRLISLEEAQGRSLEPDEFRMMLEGRTVQPGLRPQAR